MAWVPARWKGRSLPAALRSGHLCSPIPGCLHRVNLQKCSPLRSRAEQLPRANKALCVLPVWSHPLQSSYFPSPLPLPTAGGLVQPCPERPWPVLLELSPLPVASFWDSWLDMKWRPLWEHLLRGRWDWLGCLLMKGKESSRLNTALPPPPRKKKSGGEKLGKLIAIFSKPFTLRLLFHLSAASSVWSFEPSSCLLPFVLGVPSSHPPQTSC